MTFLLKACKNARAKVTQTVVDSCNFLKTTKCLNHAFQATFKGHAASNTINIKTQYWYISGIARYVMVFTLWTYIILYWVWVRPAYIVCGYSVFIGTSPDS